MFFAGIDAWALLLGAAFLAVINKMTPTMAAKPPLTADTIRRISSYATLRQPSRYLFLGSLLRGAVAIGACAIVLSMIWGMNGVWLSFLTSEIITFAVLLILGRNKESRKMNEYV